MRRAQSLNPDWSLSNQALDRFLSFCNRSERHKNAVLCRPGDQSGNLIYIIEGTVSVVVKEDDDRELILGEFHSGEFVGEIGVFIPTGPRGVFIRAKNTVKIAEISCEKLHRLMANDLREDAAVLLFAMATQLSRRLLETRRKASGLALLDVETRIRRALWDLYHETPHDLEEGPAVRISRRELASRVGCSREVSGRVIKKLADRGWLTDRGKVLLLREKI